MFYYKIAVKSVRVITQNGKNSHQKISQDFLFSITQIIFFFSCDIQFIEVFVSDDKKR